MLRRDREMLTVRDILHQCLIEESGARGRLMQHLEVLLTIEAHCICLI